VSALVMLLLHGALSSYDRPPAQIEEAVRRYAGAHGYVLEVIAAGSSSKRQEELARARIRQGGVGAVFGFSMGGYTAARLQRDFPALHYIKLGAPGVAGDIELRCDHMDMPAAFADGRR
jgi:hypothetical protein